MKIDKPQKIALVGEREHGPARPELDRLTPARWAAETPSLRAFPHPGPTRDRLARVLAGLVPDLKRVRAFNLLTPHPVAGAWDPKKARAVAAALDLSGYDLVVFCGVRAAAAAGIPTPVGEDWGLPARTSLPGVRAATVVPHPSGLSRAWNDPALVTTLRGRLAGWGSGDGSGPVQPTAVGAYIFAGGFSLGVREAGFRVLAHLEEGKFGTATARANWPDLPVHQDPGSWPLGGLEGVDLVYCNPPCLLPYEGVLTEKHGWVKIINLVRNKYQGRVACVVDGKLTYSRVTDWHENPYKGDILRVILTGGVKDSTYCKGVSVTANHQFLTKRGWVEAKDLTDIDLVATGEPIPTDRQREIIDGMLLGDAKVSRQPQFSTSQVDQGLVLLKATALDSLGVMTCPVKNSEKTWSDGAKRKDQLCLYSRTLEWTREERKRWYPNGIKVIPRDIELTDMVLANWMMDDGSGRKTTWSGREEYRSRRTVGPWISLAVHGFSPEDQELLIEKLARVGLMAELKPRKSGYVDLMIRGESANEFFKRVARFVPPSMRYKIPPGLDEFDASLWVTGRSETGWSRVSVKKIKTVKSLKVYCLGVKGPENFVTRGGVAHNCSPWSTAGIVRGISTQAQTDWASHPKASCVARCFDLLESLRPKVWCFESVRQVYTRSGGFLDDLSRRAARSGYSVDHLFVEASNHGVPQHRKRYFMVCRNLRVDWTPGEDRDPPAPLDLLAGANPEPRRRVPGSVAAVLPFTGPGENCRMAWDREANAGRTPPTPRPAFIYDRYRADRSSYTLLGSCTKVHPLEDRMLSVDECRALCGYPPDFRFLGSMADRYAQVGKGVCPPVAAWLAGNLRRALLDPAPEPVPVRRRVDVLRGRVETSDPVHLV